MVLKLDGLRKRFGRFTALDDVSLHVRKGDCYGFLGHNGAGKTTALRIALGLIPQDRGRVLVEGFDARAHPREARARQGGLIETPGFYGWMSGSKNLVHLAGNNPDLYDGYPIELNLNIGGELPELLAMSDRIMVMRDGRFKAEYNAAEATQEMLLRSAR